ncbi:hypothetical protein V8B97DRAFT_1919869 [Scleroderma yunnanense]
MYPLEWLTSTFPSRERTFELLRPELENNVLTQHDFDLAVMFLPGTHRHWPLLYASGAAGGAVCYGYYAARPRWGQRKMSIFGGAAFALGMMYGGFRRFVAHRQFSEALEDPEGFVTTLSHVHKRLGGDGNIGFTLRRIPKQRDMDADNDHNSQHPEIASESWKHSDTSGSETGNQTTAFKSRWDEIRAANARGVGQHSTWDVIRQRHERHKVSSPSSTGDESANNEQEDRVVAQARFEAMVEAERQRGRDQDRRELIR